MGDLSGMVGQATGRTVENLQPADDLVNGLYYYQFVVRANSDHAETRSRVHAAVKLVWEGALRRPPPIRDGSQGDHMP